MSLVERLKDLEAQGLQLWLEGDRLGYCAPKEILTPQIFVELEQHEADICQLLRAHTRVPIVGPLSHNQRARQFLHSLAPESTAYHVGFAARICSAINLPALCGAFQELLTRHPTLRATFLQQGRDPVQAIHPHQPLCFEHIEAAAWAWDALTARVSEAYQRPFHLATGPLFRVHLFTRAEDDHVLLLTAHHIVCDAASLWLLLDEFQVLYAAQQQGTVGLLPTLEPSYHDYVRWQQQMLESPEGEQLWTYWQQKLVGGSPGLRLPSDRPRPPVQTSHGASYRFTLPAELTEGLRKLSQTERATLYVTLLAAFQVLLHRYTGQEDLLVGAPTSARRHSEFAGLVGDLMNPVVVRSSCAGNSCFTAFLAQVRHTVSEAFAHQDLPFSCLVERLRWDRDPSRSPLFQVLFHFLLPQHSRSLVERWAAGETGERVAWAGMSLEPFPLEPRGSPFDLALEMLEGETCLYGVFTYNPDVFDAATIARLAGHFQTLLEGIVAHPGQRLAALPLLTEPEQHQLLEQWNATRADYPQEQGVHQLFDDQAQRVPAATAVVCAGQQCTYRELQAKADALARCLWRAGVRGNTLVGLCVERSLDMLVGLLGILKAGAAYLPLDPNHPRKWLDFMLQDAGATVLVTQPAVFAKLLDNTPVPWQDDVSVQEEHLTDSTLRIMRWDAQHVGHNHADIQGHHRATCLDDLAYVVYISGSTGTPQGVQIPHRAVVNCLTSMAKEPGMTAQDTMLAVTTLSCDIAGLELLLPLTVGGCLVIATREDTIDGSKLARLLNDSRATMMQATPATWRLLIETGWPGLPQLKILCGGEGLPPELARELLPRCSSLWSMYGRTETTIWSTTCRVLSADRSTIGRPIANTEVYILNEALQPVPSGVPGELYIGGDGLARGYWHQPELTARRFVPHPFSSQPGARLYKTGDIATYEPDGPIRCLGRVDRQVKIGGYRVELGEVETVISRYPVINGVVVMARDSAPDDQRLVAYIVANKEYVLSIPALQNVLQEELPDYMIPSIFVTLEKFPLNPSGQIDQSVLPAPEQSRADLEATYAPPPTPTETRLVAIWSTVFGIDKVRVEDNLFHDLGGHSLLCAQLATEIAYHLAIHVPVAALFQYQNIRALGAYLDTVQSQVSATHTLPSLMSRRAPASPTIPDLASESAHVAAYQWPTRRKSLLRRAWNRLLHQMARRLPGAMSLRPLLHRLRGVKIAGRVFIGDDVYIDNEYPEGVEIHDGVQIGLRTIILAHTGGQGRVVIEKNAFIGANCTIAASPGTTLRIGEGAVLGVASVATSNIPPAMLYSSEKAKPLAQVTTPCTTQTTYEQFIGGLRVLPDKPHAGA